MIEHGGIILITGCSGRIGHSLIHRFKGKYRLVGFDVVAPREKYENFDYVYVNINSEDALRRGLGYIREIYGPRIISVIHFAANAIPADNNYERYATDTLTAIEGLLDGLKRFHVDQFIFPSTQFVYAPCNTGQTIDEHSPVEPRWDYPKVKLLAEKAIQDERGSIPLVTLRLGSVYDDDGYSKMLCHQMQRIEQRDWTRFFFPGNPKHGHAYLHLNDLTDAVWQAVDRRMHVPHELTLLVGEDRTMGYDQLQQAISKQLTGEEINTYAIPKWFAKLGIWMQNLLSKHPSYLTSQMVNVIDDNYVLNISKAIEILGWQPHHFIGNSIPKIIERLKENPTAWHNRSKS